MPEEMLDFFGSMINMDNPRHARLRRIVSAAFNPRMIKSIEDRIELVADDVIDRVAPLGGCDFVVEVAARLPLEIICDMMGIAASDYDTVFHASNVILSSGDTEYVAEGEDPMVAFMTAAQQLNLLMTDLATYRREHPTEDVTSALVNTNVDGEALTDTEVAAFFILLVVAGNETTRNAISHGLLAMTKLPGPAGAVAGGPGGHRRHRRRRDRALGLPRHLDAPHRGRGHRARRRRAGRGRQGHHVLQLGQPGRGRLRATPSRFDVRRDPNPHIGFGAAGPHFCLGAHLARQEIDVMFRHLFERLPDIRGGGRAGPAPLALHQRHQAPRLPLHARRAALSASRRAAARAAQRPNSW